MRIISFIKIFLLGAVATIIFGISNQSVAAGSPGITYVSVPSSVVAGQKFTVKVKNTGDRPWNSGDLIGVWNVGLSGYFSQTPTVSLYAYTDPQTGIFNVYDTSIGSEITLELLAPSVAGTYVVHSAVNTTPEGYGWSPSYEGFGTDISFTVTAPAVPKPGVTYVDFPSTVEIGKKFTVRVRNTGERSWGPGDVVGVWNVGLSGYFSQTPTASLYAYTDPQTGIFNVYNTSIGSEFDVQLLTPSTPGTYVIHSAENITPAGSGQSPTYVGFDNDVTITVSDGSINPQGSNSMIYGYVGNPSSPWFTATAGRSINIPLQNTGTREWKADTHILGIYSGSPEVLIGSVSLGNIPTVGTDPIRSQTSVTFTAPSVPGTYRLKASELGVAGFFGITGELTVNSTANVSMDGITFLQFPDRFPVGRPINIAVKNIGSQAWESKHKLTLYPESVNFRISGSTVYSDVEPVLVMDLGNTPVGATKLMTFLAPTTLGTNGFAGYKLIATDDYAYFGGVGLGINISNTEYGVSYTSLVSAVNAGEQFKLKLINSGTTAWDSNFTIGIYTQTGPNALTPISYSVLGTSINPTTNGEEIEITLTAPTTANDYMIRVRDFTKQIPGTSIWGMFVEKVLNLKVLNTIANQNPSISYINVPSSVMAGRTFEVTVKNTGDRAWNDKDFLGIWNAGTISYTSPQTRLSSLYAKYDQMTNTVTPYNSVVGSSITLSLVAPNTPGQYVLHAVNNAGTETYPAYAGFGPDGQITISPINTSTGSNSMIYGYVGNPSSPWFTGTVGRSITIPVQNTGTKEWKADSHILGIYSGNPEVLIGSVSLGNIPTANNDPIRSQTSVTFTVPSVPGTYKLKASELGIAGYFGITGELTANSTANVSLDGITFISMPDRAVAGSQFNVTIKNTGQQAWGNLHRIGIYRSSIQQGQISEGAAISMVGIGTTQVGETRTVTLTAPTQTGITYVIRATDDYAFFGGAGTFGISDLEYNNIRYNNVPTNAVSGDQLTYNVTNTGSTPWNGNYTLGIYPQGSNVALSYAFLATLSQPVNPNGSTNMTLIAPSSAGTYIVRARDFSKQDPMTGVWGVAFGNDQTLTVQSIVPPQNGRSTTTNVEYRRVVSTSAGNVTLIIPANTTLSGPDSWNTKINFLATGASVLPDGGPQNLPVIHVASVEVGALDIPLSLNRAARIIFAGQAGKSVGWSRNGSFNHIDTVCLGDTQAINNSLPSDGDCYINSGADLVVWSKHFSTFTVFTMGAGGTLPNGFITAEPANITISEGEGATTKISWVSTDADSCFANPAWAQNDAWTGTKSLSGSQTVTIPATYFTGTNSVSIPFPISCSNASGRWDDYVYVSVSKTYNRLIFNSIASNLRMGESATYRVYNAGTKVWGANHSLNIYTSDFSQIKSTVSIAGVLQGEEKTVTLTAPSTAGSYVVMPADNGVRFDNRYAFSLGSYAISWDSVPESVALGRDFTFTVTNTGTNEWQRFPNDTYRLVFYQVNENYPSGYNAVYSTSTVITSGQTKTFTIRAPWVEQTFWLRAVIGGGIGTIGQSPRYSVVDSALTNAINYGPIESSYSGNQSYNIDVKNSGTKNWSGRHWLVISSSDMTRDIANISLGTVSAGASTTISVRMPSVNGSYILRGYEDGVGYFSNSQTFTIGGQINTGQTNDITYVLPIVSATEAGATFSLTGTNSGTKTWGPNHYLRIYSSDYSNVYFSGLLGNTSPGINKAVGMIAPNAAGSYKIRASENGTEFFGNELSLTVSAPQFGTNDITYITVPAEVPLGTSFAVKILNSGTEPWRSNHKIGIYSADLSTTYSEYNLGNTPPGSNHEIVMSAPAAVGNYVIKAKEGNSFFGLSKTLRVIVADICEAVSACNYNEAGGCNYAGINLQSSPSQIVTRSLIETAGSYTQTINLSIVPTNCFTAPVSFRISDIAPGLNPEFSYDNGATYTDSPIVPGLFFSPYVGAKNIIVRIPANLNYTTGAYSFRIIATGNGGEARNGNGLSTSQTIHIESSLRKYDNL